MKMDMELYAELTDSIEYALDEADFVAKESKVRFSGTDVFRRVRERIDGARKINLKGAIIAEDNL